jgi:Cys-rich repeat protein
MRAPISTYNVFIFSKLGRCTRCMRQSLIAASVGWIVLAANALMNTSGVVLVAIGFGASALSALWLAHVAAYAARAMSDTRRASAVPAAKEDAERIGRRRAIGTLLRAAGAGAFASVPVMLWSSESHAFCGQCTRNADCGVGFVCKNTAPVNSGRVCNECVRS